MQNVHHIVLILHMLLASTPCTVLPHPCGNHGNCTVSGDGSTSCSCTAGWTGARCENGKRGECKLQAGRNAELTLKLSRDANCKGEIKLYDKNIDGKRYG